jgi:hypothetical protein
MESPVKKKRKNENTKMGLDKSSQAKILIY